MVFVSAVIVPETKVGGYINTSLDLVADLIGAVLAMVIIRILDRKFFSKKTAFTEKPVQAD